MVKIGVDKSELDTPALLIDLDVMERNIDTMSKFFKDAPSDLRPHEKTHKCPQIAHKQIEAGAIGVTCAKLGEAEAMVAGGIKDVLIANQVVGEPKVSRLVSLAKHSDVIVAVESRENARHLAEVAASKNTRLNVVIEVEVGNNRCGTAPGEPTLELAKEIVSLSNLNLRGLMGYEGFCQNIKRLDERTIKVNGAMEKLVSTSELLQDKGFDMEIVSAGGTGSYMITAMIPGVTEVEAGSYIFMDTTYRLVEGLEAYDYSLTVLSTITSVPRPGVAICDAGRKTITFEPNRPMPEVKGNEGVVDSLFSEEHGRLSIGEDSKLRVGDKIEFIISHCCTNVNLFDHYHCMRGDELEAIWDITARGKSQ